MCFSPFHRVLLIQALRPDRLFSALKLFVAESLSMKSLDLPSTNVKEIFNAESLSVQPTLFIITPGADPSAEIKSSAPATVGENFVQVCFECHQRKSE
jgi:dynein heavy chain 2